jgi:hypothetical protein
MMAPYRPASVIAADIAAFEATLPKDYTPPPDDFAAQLQWDSWQTHLANLKQELALALEAEVLTPPDSNGEALSQEELRRLSIVQMARKAHAVDGVCEISDDAAVSDGDDNGAYVQAWVWVDFQRTEHDKEKKETQEGV